MGCKGVYFVHHPRTGGTYLSSSLRDQGVGVHGGHNARQWNAKDGYVVLTIIRNPIDRLCSYLTYARGLRKQQGYFSKESGWTDLDSILRPDSFELCNAMVNRLTKHGSVQEAIDNLSLFDAVGLYDRYDEFLSGLGRSFGFSIDQGCGDRNSSGPLDLSDAQRSWLMDHNQKDQSIYEYLSSHEPKPKRCRCSKRGSTILQGAKGIFDYAMHRDRPIQDVVNRRRAICRGCEHAIPCVGKVGRYCRCGKCGCLLKAKTAIKGQTCPAGKW